MIIPNDSIPAFKDAHTSVQDSLTSLRELTLTTDFKNISERKVFFDYVISIKKQYRIMEGILLGKKMPLVRPPGMRLYVTRTINPKQMEGWILKIQDTMDDLIKSPNIKLKMIKQQYTFLDMVIKVLNGDAYFVGAMHNTNMAKAA